MGELDSIADQIEQYLSESAWVSPQDFRNLLRNHVDDINTFLLRPDGKDFDGMLDGCPDVEVQTFEHELSGLNLRKIQNIVDDRKEGVAAGMDGLGIHVLLRGLRCGEKQIGHPDDPVDRGSDLVAHVCKKIAFGVRGHLGAMQFFVQTELQALDRADVFLDSDKTDDFALVVGYRGNRRQVPIERAPLAFVVKLTPPGSAGCDGFPEVAVERRILLSGFEESGMLAKHLGAAVAGGIFKGWVHVFDDAFAVGDDDGIGALLDGGPQVEKLLLGLLASGDIADRDAAAGWGFFHCLFATSPNAAWEAFLNTMSKFILKPFWPF